MIDLYSLTRSIGFDLAKFTWTKMRTDRKDTIMFDKLKKQWNENPLGVIVVAAFAASAAAKLIDAMSAAEGRRAYARQVNYKVNHH